MPVYFRDTQLAKPRTDALIKHVVLECFGVAERKLDHPDLLRFIHQLCDTFNLHIVDTFDHQFSPYGSTIVFVLEESHIAVYSWPEHGYIHCDIVTCSEEHLDPALLRQFTARTLSPLTTKILRLKY